MKILLMMITLLFPDFAHAGILPFFNHAGGVNTNKWFYAGEYGSWAEQNCWWKPAEITDDKGALKLSIHSKADFTGIINDIPKNHYACGQIQSLSQQNYGHYEVVMKSAAGSGLNSAFFVYSATPHDEIDFEFLGLHPTQVSINYFVNGVNMGLSPVNLGFDASQGFHTYAFDWLPDRIIWYVDGVQVYRTKDAAPQPSHLSRIYADLWTGMNGWLGNFNYIKPVSAEYKTISFTPLVK